MSLLNAFFCFFVGFILTAIRITLRTKHEVRLAVKDDFREVELRLFDYARMKCPNLAEPKRAKNNLTHRPSKTILRPEEHSILLGVLKKAEAKSAVLIVVVIFALPNLFSGFSALFNHSWISLALIYLVCGALFALLLAGVDGANHLGQPHFRKKVLKRNDRPICPRELQRELILDMLRKEAVLDLIVPIGGLCVGLCTLAFLFAASSQPPDSERHSNSHNIYCEQDRC